jgi:hypothetical protein
MPETAVLNTRVVEVSKQAFALFNGMQEEHRCAQGSGPGATWDRSYTVSGSADGQALLLVVDVHPRYCAIGKPARLAQCCCGPIDVSPEDGVCYQNILVPPVPHRLAKFGIRVFLELCDFQAATWKRCNRCTMKVCSASINRGARLAARNKARLFVSS